MQQLVWGEEIIQGYLKQGSTQHVELHAIYQVLKQYRETSQNIYIYADNDFCVKGIQYWMHYWNRNE